MPTLGKGLSPPKRVAKAPDSNAGPKKGGGGSGAPARKPANGASGRGKGPAVKSATRTPDVNARRQVAGGSTSDDVAAGYESTELRTLHEAERELFPPASPVPGTSWPAELGSPLSAAPEYPHVHASGLPPAPVASAPPSAEGGRDLSWMADLKLPDFPIRWDPRVVRYLEFFKDDPRGRTMLAIWYRRSGRYRSMVSRVLRRKSAPEDLFWLAMVESGFDPAARSPVGALGLWQFMPETGRQYGLLQDRWVDHRLHPQLATEAAADFLNDLHRRFGSWELAIASYNMGYAGMLALVRKFNTNDFWTLSRLEGALPWETTLYVPKIMAAAIVGRNLAVFGISEDKVEPAVAYDEVAVPPGTALSSVASAIGAPTKEISELNLELRAQRTPPLDPSDPKPDPARPGEALAAIGYPVKVPAGKGVVLAQNMAKIKKNFVAPERYVVRFGESLEQIASARSIALAKIIELNGIAQGEVVRGGTVLLLPPGKGGGSAPSPASSGPAASSGDKPVVIVPSDVFVYPDRRRVFYRVVTGDTLRDVAGTFHVSVDEIRRWNEIDPVGRLQEGMTLQLFVPADADLSKVMVLSENDVRTIAVGTEDFFTYWEGQKGRRRITVAAKAGETIEMIGRRYGVTPASMERINRKSRNEGLKEGEVVVVYLPPNSKSADPGASAIDPFAGEPLGPLPPAPAPNALP
ncbi:transglycosylase SLT domain-containing protein [Pendulispora albinea]|uniref:LysM peptidoglycan-binding domain-containing protein n=1 Tax=Pendulispora albinea TaxID=2741071 RepID=A0ABZ2LRV6_9BACT